MEHELQGGTLYATDGAFFTATPDIDIDSELGGLKSVLAEASLTPLSLKGTGSVFIEAYGGLERIDLAAGESYTLDNEHVTAWEDRIDLSTRTRRWSEINAPERGGTGLRI